MACLPSRPATDRQYPPPCNCGRPYAYVENGLLCIESRHGGEVHRNRLTLAEILALFKAAGVEPPQRDAAA